MQSKTSPPVPPPGNVDETYVSSLILARLLHCVKHYVIHETGSIFRIALLLADDKATATVDIYRQEAQLPQRDRATRYVSKFVLCFTRYES